MNVIPMTTKAAFQKSHNSRYSHCSYKTTLNGYFNARTQLDFENYLSGVEYGRKQALEEAAAICKVTCDPNNTDNGNGYNRGALDCENKIKQLLKE